MEITLTILSKAQNVKTEDIGLAKLKSMTEKVVPV